MSFAIWRSAPPFLETDLNAGERIWKVGDVWVVTDQGEPTAEQVSAVLNPPPAPSEAEQLVARIKADPAALARLKSELAKV